MTQTSYMAKPGGVESRWYLVDARGQVLGRLAVNVERTAHVPRVAPQDGRPRFAAGHHVAVCPAHRVAARVEAFTAAHHLDDGNVGGERRVECKPERARFPIALQIEPHHLCVRVSAGIGASRSGERRFLAARLHDGVAQDTRDGAHSRLDLPAVEVGSVVLERQTMRSHDYWTSSMMAMGALSLGRGASFTMRV